MKLLSTGDWHFNAGYDDDVAASVDQIMDYISRHELDMAILTGDIYDKASEPGSRNLAAQKIQAMADVLPVMIIRGNHDAPGDLDILAKLECNRDIKVFDTPTLMTYVSSRAIEHPVNLHFLPWITKARWVSLHPEATTEAADRTVSQLVMEYLRNNIALSGDIPSVLVGHITIAGARAEHRQQMGADGVTLGLQDLYDLGFKASMLGHIHLRQMLGKATDFYNGSIAPLDYGESFHKYFSVVDTKTWDVEWIELKTVPRIDVNAHWTPAGISVECPVSLDLLRGTRVRANLRVEGGDNIAQAKDMLERWLQNAQALEYKINPQVIPVSKIRAVEISKAASMGEKLMEYWKANNAFPCQETQTDMFEKLEQVEDECCL